MLSLFYCCGGHGPLLFSTGASILGEGGLATMGIKLDKGMEGI